MRAVIARNPFEGRKDVVPEKLLVHFLARDPGKAARDKVASIQCDPEELHCCDRELYVFYASGLARPKLSAAAVERVLGVSFTGRNWNSVTKMLAFAEGMER
jgi:uncharacterized protein (DUF1697 family)